MTPDQYGAQVAQSISSRLSGMLDEHSQVISSFSERLVNAGRTQARSIRDAMAGEREALDEQITNYERRLSAAQQLLDSSANTLDSALADLAEKIGLLERANETIDGKLSELSDLIDQANAASSQAIADQSAAERSRAEAEAEYEKASAEVARAEKAIALMQKRAQVEVDRATWEMDHKTREKATLKELSDERQFRSNEFDRMEEILNASISETFTELSEKLDALMSKSEDDSDASES